MRFRVGNLLCKRVPFLYIPTGQRGKHNPLMRSLLIPKQYAYTMTT